MITPFSSQYIVVDIIIVDIIFTQSSLLKIEFSQMIANISFFLSVWNHWSASHFFREATTTIYEFLSD